MQQQGIQQIPRVHHRRQQKDSSRTPQSALDNSSTYSKDSEESLMDVASANGGRQMAKGDLNCKKNVATNGSIKVEEELLPPSGTAETNHPQKQASQKERKRRQRRKRNRLKSTNSSVASAQSQESVGETTTASEKEETETNKDIVLSQSAGGMQEGNIFTGTAETNNPLKRASQKERKKRWRKKKRNQLKSTNSSVASAQSQESVGETTTAYEKEERETNKDIVLSQSAGGMQEGNIFTDALQKRRKRKRKRKSCQGGESSEGGVGSGRCTDKVEEIIHPVKKMKATEGKKKEREPPALGPSTKGNKQCLSGSQKRERNHEATEAGIENFHRNKVQNPSDMASEEPEEGERKEKRKLNEISNSSLNVVGSSDSKKVATVKKEKETPEGCSHPQQGEGSSNVEDEELVKQGKRKIKKEINQIDGPLADVIQSKEGREEIIVVDFPTKKLKKESTEGNPVSEKEIITLRRGLKMNPFDQSEKERKPILTASQKNKQKKKDKQQVNDSSSPNAANSPHTKTSTAWGEQAASTSATNSQQTPILHPSCTSNATIKKMLLCWAKCSKEGTLIKGSKIEVIKNPFTCCYIPHLLESEEYLEGVKKELDDIELLNKNNDLYKFRQTGDLKGVTTPFIAGLRHFLLTDLREWLINITGIPLNNTVDMGSSRYAYTDVLLCHDDELEGRRIAYILYLVPPWGPDDGGTLDLFSVDEHGHPRDIVRSLTPKNNAFAFFEVSPVSFHQVSEVLSRDKTRLSINGWFHGPPITRLQRNLPPPLECPVHIEEEDFYAWINPMYLDMEIQKEIRQKFCSESELELENFLTDEAYERLSRAFRGEGLTWQLTGPADRQRYEILEPGSMPQDITDCRQFLGCEALFLVLSQLTGLKLHPMAPQDSDDDDEESHQESSAESSSRSRVEAQRWGPGSYTLIRDDCVDGYAALDAFLYINVPEQWTQQLGGYVAYIAKDEDEELLTVVPRSNCLCLVYRDAQTLRFTKYINASARDLGPHSSCFHNFACVYYE